MLYQQGAITQRGPDTLRLAGEKHRPGIVVLGEVDLCIEDLGRPDAGGGDFLVAAKCVVQGRLPGL